jgi:hypothetical protein
LALKSITFVSLKVFTIKPDKMKTLKLLFWGMMLLNIGSAQSQVTVELSMGGPAWGPAGHDGVRYYYLPDVEAYYDVQTSMFLYYCNNRWVRRSHLPNRYRNYDLYHGYKVVMNDYHGNEPYADFHDYRAKYHKGYRGEEQRNIRERVMMRREKTEHLQTNPERKAEKQQRTEKSVDNYRANKPIQANPQRDNGQQSKGENKGRR